MLNQEYEWHDVRYQINRQISYDVDLSFNGRPVKEQLPSGTPLYRLDFPVFSAVFM